MSQWREDLKGNQQIIDSAFSKTHDVPQVLMLRLSNAFVGRRRTINNRVSESDHIRRVSLLQEPNVGGV